MTRVLHVLPELRRGGAETVVRSLVSALDARGVHVEIAAADGPWRSAFRAPQHPVPLVGRQPVRLLPAVRALRHAITRSSPDIVHAHNPTMALAVALASWAKTRGSLVTVHGVADEDYAAAARVLRLSRLPVVACGPGVRTAIEAAGGSVWRTILNGVPPAAPAADPRQLRADLGWPPDSPLLASVGRLAAVKRHDLALRTLVELPDVRLLLMGTGAEGPALHRLADELGVAERTAFLGLRDDVSALLGAVDLLICCSAGEGLPLAVLEGMAAGLPVVATDVRGVRELVTDGVDGLLCESQVGTLASAVRRVMGDRVLESSLRRGALATAQKHTEETMVDQYIDAYTEIGGRSR